MPVRVEIDLSQSEINQDIQMRVQAIDKTQWLVRQLSDTRFYCFNSTTSASAASDR